MSNCLCNSVDMSADPLSRKSLVQVQPEAQSQTTSHSASPDRETRSGRTDASPEHLQLNIDLHAVPVQVHKFMWGIGNAK
jgi:hypothetical protein